MARFFPYSNPLQTLKEWAILLRNLTFTDNFSGYEWEGSIDAGEERRITHPLKRIPTRFIVVESRETPLLIKGRENNPTKDFFYVQNIATTSTFTGKIVILP